MSPTVTECLEHARQCEWYAARTNDEEDRKFFLRKAKYWTKLAAEKELEVRASARATPASVRIWTSLGAMTPWRRAAVSTKLPQWCFQAAAFFRTVRR